MEGVLEQTQWNSKGLAREGRDKKYQNILSRDFREDKGDFNRNWTQNREKENCLCDQQG